MNDVEYQLSQAETIFGNVAFLIAKGEPAKEIHSTIVKGLIILSEVRKIITATNTGDTRDTKETKYSQKEADEIKKVQRRLRLWAKPEKQSNINSKILNAFLKLRKSGNKHITEMDIQNQLPGIWVFKSNFDQMKNISEKNHGKIFEQNGNYIEIWEPVNLFVSEYESYKNKNNIKPKENIDSVAKRPTNLEIIYYPINDVNIFKQELIKKKLAYIKLHKTNDKSEIKEWNANRFTVSSDVVKNLRSGYLRDWKDNGIFKAELSTNKNDLL